MTTPTTEEINIYSNTAQEFTISLTPNEMWEIRFALLHRRDNAMETIKDGGNGAYYGRQYETCATALEKFREIF
jgi:hypothetical protein